MHERVPIRLDPVSAEDSKQILNELQGLLTAGQFASSKRYPAFLSYVVQKSLNGQADDLKERSIGIDVFHRRPDFDTSNDTIVRFTAGEVRKRLATIYHEHPRTSGVQIELPLGGYAPEFFRIEVAPKDSQRPTTPPELPFVVAPSASIYKSWGHPSIWIAAAVSLAILAIIWLLHSNSVERFWKPVQSSANPVIIAPGAFVFSSTSPAGRMLAEKTDEYPYTSMASTTATAGLTQLFGQRQMDYIVQTSVSTSLTDMRAHPIVLLGAYDNEWTLRLTENLPFRFAPKPATEIRGTQNPSFSWTRPKRMPDYKDADDYAIVARFRDKLTENIVIILAGLGKNGTAVAAQFVTSRRYLDMLDHDARLKGWARGNMEVVLKVKVVDGKSGPLSIEAAKVW